MKDEKVKIYIGFITYGKSTSKYLPYFLFSLKKQTFKNFKVIAIDNSEEENNENKIFIKNNFSEIEFSWAGKNLGFAKAYNKMINKAIEAGAEYFLALNPDMIFDSGMVEKMVEAIDNPPNPLLSAQAGYQGGGIGAVAPKILKWDFPSPRPPAILRGKPLPLLNVAGEGRNKEMGKTNIIDSYGLAITKEHCFFDREQGRVDNPNLVKAEEVFGFTGAAVLFNLSALRGISFFNGENSEYFDELMFMYKEDCDLSYRLRLAGWKIVFVPKAIAYHDRAVAPKGETSIKIALNRLNKSRQVKKWSFLNQWILLLKLKNLPFSWSVKYATIWYQLKSLIFVLFFEQYLLKEFVKLWKIRDEIKKKREQLKIRVEIKEIEKFMK